MKPWSSVSVSVAALDEVLKLWRGVFGLETVASRHGDDPELARLWRVSPGEIMRQALVATPGENTGMLHFVEFDRPGPAIRENAGDFDLCPKNLDVYVRDMPARIAELKSAGYQFHKTDYSETTTPDGITFRVMQMAGHDKINIVLMEVLGMPVPFTDAGYAAVGPVVTVVADANSERGFYQDICGLDLLNDVVLEGPVVERMVGLPPGSAMRMSIWGKPDSSFGRIEIGSYRGVDGDNLFPRAVPKQRGILQVTFGTRDLAGLTRRLEQAGIAWSDAGRLVLLPGNGHFIRTRTPAGFQVDVFEAAQ